MMTTKRAVTYARFSTELQSERSIEDQQVLCRKYCDRNDLTIVAEYSDRARSGGSILGRDGLIALMDAAKAGAFDVLVVEALDRISRDMEDLAALHKRLTFAGIDIVAVHDGKADTITVGLRGLIGQMYREDNVHKIRRGMSGVVRDGRHAGGRAYGYRPVPGRSGELEIVEAEAEVVRRIFTLYRDGKSPRAIAGVLNAEGIPPPRGTRWNGSTINGNKQRGTGILQNSLYRGEIIWNRVHMVRDPETGRRLSRVNPEKDWQIVPAPHLRVVSEDVAAQASIRKANISPRENAGRKSYRLLSGLLRCGSCGGGMSSVGSDRSGPRVQCSTYVESRSCKNGSRFYVEKIEAIVLDGLREGLSDPELIREYVDAYRAERQRVEAAARRERAAIERRLADATAAISRLVDALADGTISKADVADRLVALRATKAEAEQDLVNAGTDTKVVELHPQAIRRFQKNIERVASILSAGKTPDAEVIANFRELVESVIVMPRAAGEPYEVRPQGDLAAIMGLSAELMVAGERVAQFGRNGRPVISLGRWRRE